MAESARRRWLDVVLALLCALMGAGAGVALQANLPRIYTASTTVLVLPTASGLDSGSAGSRTQGDVQIETESELLLSAQVADVASKAINGSLSAKELLRNATVTVPPNSQVLTLVLSAGTPEKARDGAKALAQAYLDRRAQQSAGDIENVVSSLEKQRTDLEARLKENTTALTALAPDANAQRALLESQRGIIVDEISDVNSRLVALGIQNTPGGEIVTEAALPDSASSPVPLVTIGGGLLVGVLAGGGLLLALSRLRGRSSVAARETTARVPVLATVTARDPAAGDDGSVFVDEESTMRRLCLRISSYQGGPGPTVVVGVGDPLLRARFALSLNRAWSGELGGSVLVLAQAGASYRETGLPASADGLRDVLAADADLLEAVAVPVGTFAGLLGPGRDPARVPPAEQRGLLPEVWGRLGAEFGAVLVTTGSPLDDPLSQSIAQSAGRFVVLVEVGVGQQRDLTSTLEEIEWLTLADRVAGVVIVNSDGSQIPSAPALRGQSIQAKAGRSKPTGTARKR